MRRLWWDAALADARYAFRGVRASPPFTAAVVIALALGIGAAAMLYGVMSRLLLQPPPHIVAPSAVVRPFFHYEVPGRPARATDALSYPFLELLRDDARSLAAVAAYATLELPIGQGTGAGTARATAASAGFWSLLGVRAALGRFFGDDEAHPVTGARVAVLGHDFWQRRYGGDPTVVGRVLEIRNRPYEIVGVAPRGFRGVGLADTDLWLPLYAYGDGDSTARGWHTLTSGGRMFFVARLRPSATPALAGAELSRIHRLFLDESNRALFGRALSNSTRTHVSLGSVTGSLGHDKQPIPVARVVVWLVGVAGILLVIASANVATLLLLRGLRRRREITVRLALGMSTQRLVSLLLMESAMFALLSGIVAMVVVVWGGAWVRRALLPGMLGEATVIDGPTLLVSAGCVLGALIGTALGPVIQSRRDGIDPLKDGGQQGSTRRSGLQRGLLVAQSALSVVLLIGAGLFLRSLQRISALDLGLDTENVLTVDVAFEGTSRSDSSIVAFYERALERVRALPRVQHASVAEDIPLHVASAASIRLPGSSEWLQTEQGSQSVNDVSGEFFATTGMRIVEGRPITDADRTGSPVVVVNEALARYVWQGRSPVGECVYTRAHEDVCATVVGVVKNSRTFRLREATQKLWFYRPLALGRVGQRVLLVRVSPGARGMEGTVRRAVQELESDLPFVDVRVLGDVLDPQIRPWRLGATVFTAFGLLAALLAALGLYAAVSYAVTQRTRELGVRMAVGATPREVMGLVLRDGARVALAGTAVGVVLGLIAGRWIAELLFDVSPRDVLVFVAVAGAMLLMALLASLPPARRAVRVDPMAALRLD